MTTKYHIEKAKSARSKCKKCKETIIKDDMRIGTSSERDDRVMTSWNHIKCFTFPKALQKEGATVESFLSEDLDDPDDLIEEHREEIMEGIESKAAKKTPVKKAAADSSTMLGKIKRNYQAVEGAAADDDDNEDRPAKKAKLSASEKEEVELYETYMSKNAEELKDYMRWNHQVIQGRKDVLILRCIDGQMRGRLARCPMCKQGRPRIMEEDHDFSTCSGYFDEDAQARVPCSYKISLLEAARVQQPSWYTEPLTEEQEAEFKAMDELAKSGKAAPNPKNDVVMEELLVKAKKVDWKASSKDEIKATAAAMLKICQDGGVALPKGSEQKAVGKLVVANAKSSTAQQVMQLIIDEYGFAQDKAAAGQATGDAAISLCKVAANAPLYSILDEFAELMRKAGEYMKSNTYKKAASAIAALEFEVTEENALKLGKAGKLKVAGIGKSTAEKMYEFMTTGAVEKLEQLKASVE